MRVVNIKIQIRPLNDTNMNEWTKANNKSIEIISKISKEIALLNTEGFLFDFEITAK